MGEVILDRLALGAVNMQGRGLFSGLGDVPNEL